MTRTLALVFALAAGAAAAQQQLDERQLPSEASCNAIRDRVQLSLAQADRALQGEDFEEAARWTGIAADYATIHASFCEVAAPE